MRWEGRTLGVEDESALAGMGRLAGFVRTVRTPDFAGVSFHEVHSKSALNKVPGATGLTWGEAFAAISSVPAAIAGLRGTAGVLTGGAFGDVVLWDGDPLELGSAPLRVFIDGIEQPLDAVARKQFAARYVPLAALFASAQRRFRNVRAKFLRKRAVVRRPGAEFVAVRCDLGVDAGRAHALIPCRWSKIIPLRLAGSAAIAKHSGGAHPSRISFREPIHEA